MAGVIISRLEDGGGDEGRLVIISRGVKMDDETILPEFMSILRQEPIHYWWVFLVFVRILNATKGA